MTKDKIQIYEVVIRQNGCTNFYTMEAKHHAEAIKKFGTFADERANGRAHYSELLYSGEQLNYIHRLK